MQQYPATQQPDCNTVLTFLLPRINVLDYIVNTKKTEVLWPSMCMRHQQATAAHPPLQFTVTRSITCINSYLGSILTSDCDLNNEVQQRVKLASAAFGRLSRRVFLNPVNRNLATATKIAVYKAIVSLCSAPVWLRDMDSTPYRSRINNPGGLSHAMSRKHPRHSLLVQGHSC